MRTVRHTATVLASAAALLALSACGGMSMGAPAAPMSPSASMATTVSMVTELAARNEVPPTASTGKGRATATLDRTTRVLTWSVQYEGLTGPATGAHIHAGAEGTNGPVVVPFAVTPSPITGSTTLTEAQVAQLAQGLWYVNVHTAANPGGEIRGQLK